ncbi:hypothetical protein L226DRAFT_528828 [Lentinus tigrinus ALCF2SS1-7]|uniref:uncharacterized protein n=1 Tax=Lentinus tigrinus ALCF2SS1-7 TaxID=1328758 RepID=UPI001165FD0F|nr:hypothetical protein L226DRAFT_528828 [Lentinus tigrinus ALCF2SS1-7]
MREGTGLLPPALSSPRTHRVFIDRTMHAAPRKATHPRQAPSTAPGTMWRAALTLPYAESLSASCDARIAHWCAVERGTCI